MAIKEKVERFLVDLGLSYNEQGENIWIVYGEEKGLENFIVMVEYPLLVVRVNVMRVPDTDRCAFFEELLKLNATDLFHGSYGLDGDNVILIDTLEVETLDIEELQASIDAMGLALVQHYELLSRYRKNA
jgi:hypothetical protein